MDKAEALQLADELTEISKDPWAKYWERCLKAAAELRRLHTVEQQRDELLAALKKRDSVEQHLNTEIENHSLAVYEATKLLSQAREQRDELLEALKLALSAHGVMLLSDPPQEAWKTYGVEQKARVAIARATGEQI